MRPIAAHGFQRVLAIQRSHAAGQFWPVINAFGKITVARRAFFGKDFFAHDGIARAFGQARAIGAHVFVPGGDFFGQGGAAKAKPASKGRGGEGNSQGGCGSEIKKLRHFQPPHWA